MECKHCGKHTTNDEFCNRSCSLSHFNKTRVHSDESKRKRAETLRKKLPEQEIIDLYNSGKSANEIRKQFSCARNTILSVLKRNGIQIRTSSESITLGKENSYKVVSNKGKFCDIHQCEYSPYNNGRYVCKPCKNAKITEHRRQLKLKAVEYKGGKCTMCGYDKCIAALEFHHLDPTQKDFSISKTGSTRSFKTMQPELDKCVLVCANCHREEHDRLRKDED
jgi:HNH endonuclease.